MDIIIGASEAFNGSGVDYRNNILTYTLTEYKGGLRTIILYTNESEDNWDESIDDSEFDWDSDWIQD